jgi:hypothetical protein
MCLVRGGWVPSEQICRQVQEVEEVREAHKATASAKIAVTAEMAQSTQSWRKKEQLLGTRAGIKKGSYLLPGLNQGVCKRANITLPILHMPGVVGVYLTPGQGSYRNKITYNPIKFPFRAKKHGVCSRD